MLQAAARLFSERGFHATPVETVTEEAGFSRGAFYSNFERKEDLLLALLEEDLPQITQVFDRLNKRVGKVVPLLGQEAVRPAALPKDLVDIDRKWSLLFLELWVCAARDEEIRSRLHDTLASIRSSLAQQMSASFEQQGIEPELPVEDFAAALLVIGSGWLFAELADPGGVPDRVLANLLPALWQGFAGGAQEGPSTGPGASGGARRAKPRATGARRDRT